MASLFDDLMATMSKDISIGERENGARDLLDLAAKRQARAISASEYDDKLKSAKDRYQINNTEYLNKIDAILANSDRFNGEESKQRRDRAQARYDSLLNAHVNTALVDQAVAQGWVDSGEIPRDEKANIYGAPAELRRELTPEQIAAYDAGYTPPKAELVKYPERTNSFQTLREADAAAMAPYNQPPVVAPVEKTKQAPTPNAKPRTLNDELNEKFKFEGDREEAFRKIVLQKRAKLLTQGRIIAGNLHGAGTDAYKAQVEMFKEQIDAAFPETKPITEQPQFKIAEQEGLRAGHQQNLYTLGLLHNELKLAKGLLAEGKEKEARAYLTANVPKILQSLGTGQSDAVQTEEAKRLLFEFMTVFNSNPTTWPGLISSKGFGGSFAVDTKGFIEKAERIYKAGAGYMNSIYDARQNQLGEAINQTSHMRLNDEIGTSGKMMDVLSIRNAFQGIHKVDPLEYNPFSDGARSTQTYGQQSAPPQSKPSQLQSGRIINATGGRLNAVPNTDIKENF